jgi:hypothetical protein
LKSLLVMAGAAAQQTESDDAIAHDHHGGKNGVAREICLFGRSGNDDRYDQRDFNDGDGDSEQNRAEWLANPMRHHLGMVDGCKNRADER